MSGWIARRLSRRSRIPRWIRAGVALTMGTLALLMLSSSSPGAGQRTSQPPGATFAAGGPTGEPNSPSKSPIAPAAGEAVTTFTTSPSLVAEGRGLFSERCSSCHGVDLRGRHGLGPSLIGVGAGPVDFYLSTGRMPLENPREEPMRSTPSLDPAEIRALVAYVSAFGGPPAPAADPAKGDLALGFHDFTLHCAGCHQIVARGGLTLGAVVPSLQSATPRQIAEAVRMGPYLMPHFDAGQIDQHALDSIARYVLWTRAPEDKGGWGIYNLGPIPEGMVAWFLALAALVIVARLIGERTT